MRSLVVVVVAVALVLLQLAVVVQGFLVKPATNGRIRTSVAASLRPKLKVLHSTATAPATATTAASGAEQPVSTWVDAKTMSEIDADQKIVMTNEQIAKILPHRYPFLLVDRVVAFEPGKRICGIKCITANEPQFTGHFPERPIMPGVLQIEAMAQLGGLLCLQPPVTSGEGQRIFFFTGVEGVRWKTPLVPGDRLFMEMSLISFDDRMGFAKLTGNGFVRGRVSIENMPSKRYRPPMIDQSLSVCRLL
jgi:3-hydroxyacyl-[acyl-carrier-protein] dehydratase